MTDVVTVPAVRSLLQAALGLGLATAAVTSLGAPGRHDQGVATAAVAQEAGGARLMMLQVNGDSFGSAVMRQGEPPSSLPWVVRAEPREPTTPVREWEVQTGEHFWSIAEQVLSEAWNRTPTNDEVAPYWRALVAHNQDTLADPDNPDLVFPGQVFHIPAPPAATSN